MINLESALVILLVAQTVGSLLSYLVFKREIRGTIDRLFKEPVVSRAMGIMGAKSGEVRHDKAVLERIAGQVLSNPDLTGIKIIGKQLGLDLDEMIEQEGAVDTLVGLSQIASMAGIDITSILGGNLKSGAILPSTGENPYFKQR